MEKVGKMEELNEVLKELLKKKTENQSALNYVIRIKNLLKLPQPATATYSHSWPLTTTDSNLQPLETAQTNTAHSHITTTLENNSQLLKPLTATQTEASTACRDFLLSLTTTFGTFSPSPLDSSSSPSSTPPPPSPPPSPAAAATLGLR